MIVVYADGGGLGHLTRVQALRATLDLAGPITVLTSSHHVDDDRVVDGLRTVPIPIRRNDRAARRSWLQRTLAGLEPTTLIVDAFPAGLAGEIDAATVASSVRTLHVARLLRWPVYRRILPARGLHFDQTYVLEPLHPDHDDHLRAVSERLDPLELLDPPAPAGVRLPADSDLRTLDHAGPRWLVAHTGPAAEVAELVAYARDQAAIEGLAPLLVVACPSDAAPPAAADVVPLDRYPVWPLFAAADRIITAAGFNTMRQLAAHRDRHRFVPMPRRFDDQPERARRARREQDARAEVGPGAVAP